MAKATASHKRVTITLELDEAEAQYVLEALRNTHPRKLGGGDPVFNALDDTMRDAGVERDDEAV